MISAVNFTVLEQFVLSFKAAVQSTQVLQEQTPPPSILKANAGGAKLIKRVIKIMVKNFFAID
ncbi:MAG: hypothetical protein COS96_03320 [Candidatus Nealsonbacteria bacterium CG07_land_8_20_14_0_80_39_13]|nr:MAG: hypothetical protein COS96_03320 [Candidatus Nealsonbacteria bacterium CG07_land_8_20_14_0_80_39_13]